MASNLVGVGASEGSHTTNSLFEQYPAAAGRLSKKEIRAIKDNTRELYKTSPSDALSYLAGTRGYLNWRPDSLIAKLNAKPVDYDRYKGLAGQAYQDLLGRSMKEDEWSPLFESARVKGIKDPNVFDAFINQRLASTPEGQRKIKSEADIAWESQHGTMPRDAQGNLIRGMVRYDQTRVNSMIGSMLGLA
jgi:hypothetical protein